MDKIVGLNLYTIISTSARRGRGFKSRHPDHQLYGIRFHSVLQGLSAPVSKTGRSNPVQVRVLSSAPTILDTNQPPFTKIGGFFFAQNWPKCDPNATETFWGLFISVSLTGS